MNLDRTFELQVTGTRDVAGTGSGLLSEVAPIGWDYATAVVGRTNEYVFSTPFDGMTEFNTTLSWQRREEMLFDTFANDIAQANLSVSFWSITFVGLTPVFSDMIAESASLYNTVEHLSFTVPTTGYYGLRVSYPNNTFDRTSGQVWGNASNPQPYGVAWSLTAVPEPSTMLPHAVLLAGALTLRKRSRKGLFAR